MPHRLKTFLVIVLILLSLLPAWYLNRWLQRVIQPRKSFGQFLLYIITAFALVFGYTFLVVLAILKLLPPG